MKKSTAVIAATVIFLSLSFSVFAQTSYLYPSDVIKNKNSFHVIAHRGLNSLAPENSLSAFRLAGQYGFWGCEFDIYPTTDGKWAVMHDPTVDRMTNGSGSIVNMSFKELSSFRIDKGANIKKYPDEKIPELSEALDICKKYGMHPIIEIKGGSSSQIKELCKFLSKREEKADFILTSFSGDTLKAVRENMSGARIWLLTFGVTDYDIAFCQKYGVECIDSSFALTSKADTEKVIASGIESGVWTADKASDMEKLYSWGVKYATTDSVLPVNSPKEAQEPTQPETQSKTTEPQTNNPSTGTLNDYLSEENKALLGIVYSEAEKAVKLCTKLFG
ncbi:MAG: glycerophosphodiester phosphodiesterase family protein [Acutalibacteraceae bacterium]